MHTATLLFWREPKSFFDSSRSPNETKKEILDQLSDTESALLLSCLTSDSDLGAEQPTTSYCTP